MPSSDSEDFESADEGHSNVEKKERKHRKSSSNYSDNASEAEAQLKRTPQKSSSTVISDDKPKVKDLDGWDDFDVEETEPVPSNLVTEIKKLPTSPSSTSAVSNSISNSNKEAVKEKSQDTGWDEFEDWGENITVEKQKEQTTQSTATDAGIKEVTERLAASSTTSGSGWGWGWGVDSLLSTATAGFTTITNQVSQGISTVLETGIGAPDPEELARKTVKDSESKETKYSDRSGETNPDPDSTEKVQTKDAGSAGDGAFPFGSILKFVGSTGTKVISGGLDTLETIGRKTMEVLQDGDPGLAKKRAMLGLDPDKPVLSQVLREAKAKAEEEDRIKEEKREAKEVHYENLFDDYEGLVHLEALEMLSKQVYMRIEERLRTIRPEDRTDMKETLQQVAELCEIPEEEDDDEENSGDDALANLPKDEAFLERLQKATEDLGVKLQFQPLVKQYTDILSWLNNPESDFSDKAVYKRAISSLAQATALSVELYHKAAEMLLVKPRRLTADEADAMTQMTVVLKKHVSEIATLLTEKMDSNATYENAMEVNNYITNIFLEAHNSSKYIQNALDLALPILQIGAV